MKKKKILVRIGAILACVLLVGSLAITAFADELPTGNQTRATVSFGSASDWFRLMLGPANTLAYQHLYDHYIGYGDMRLFQMDYLVSGVSAGSTILPFTFNAGEENASIFAQIPVDALSYVFYELGNTTPTYRDVISGGTVNVTIYANSTDGYTLWVSYVQSGQIGATFTLGYKGTDAGLLLPHMVVVVGNQITDTYSNVQLAFTIRRASSEWSPMLTTLCGALFDDSTPAQLDNVLFSPKQFYYGLDSSYNLGYDDGLMVDNQSAYDEGYEAGYTDGVQETDPDGAYDLGYQDALNEVESGDFGRNFIGGILRAPMDMLRNFVLIEWTTNTGTEVVINLATIFTAVISVSLFIWFLKLFAGG